MTEEQKIMFFNKPSNMSYNEWHLSEARYLLDQMPNNDKTEWVPSSDMTDEEKEKNPTYKTTGGYLKVIDDSESVQIWWDNLSEHNKNVIKAIPNFDADIFYECTGIRVDEK